MSTALAATIGTGSIAGIATAIATGGPGAIFWMWVATVLGITTKYAEVVLAIQFREKTEDERFVGGPMYYIKNGIKNKKVGKILGFLFSFFGMIAAFGTGAMVQSNAISDSLKTSFGVPVLFTGIIVSVLTALVVLGGINRIGKVTEVLVPFMSIFYVSAGIIVLILNITLVPAAFAIIIKNAFTGTAAVGGFLGAGVAKALRFGVARGVFSNEAGLGSAPIAHAAASTDHPVRQGLWGIFEVFTTLIVCTMTALVIVISGLWQEGLSGATLTINAFSYGMPGNWGGIIVSIGGALFAFSTILGWEYYGERCAEFIIGPKVAYPYRILFIPLVIIGAIGGLDDVWAIADTFNGLMAIPNLIGLLLLSKVVLKLTKEFWTNKELMNKSI